MEDNILTDDEVFTSIQVSRKVSRILKEIKKKEKLLSVGIVIEKLLKFKDKVKG